MKMDLYGITLTSLFTKKTVMEKNFRLMAETLMTVRVIIILVEMELLMEETESHLQKCRK